MLGLIHLLENGATAKTMKLCDSQEACDKGSRTPVQRDLTQHRAREQNPQHEPPNTSRPRRYHDRDRVSSDGGVIPRQWAVSASVM